MPSTYAHYRFGAQAIPMLPTDLRSLVQRNRAAFDVGTHGPDLFFFYLPTMKTAVGKLGTVYHRQSGKNFFGAVCRRLRMHPSETATAYLYGVLTHYCLDSVCHPLVNRASAKGLFSHTALESEFDRFLLKRDGTEKPHFRNLSKHMNLSVDALPALQVFYPTASREQLQIALRSMAGLTRLVSTSNPVLRALTGKVLRATGESNAGLIMQPEPDQRCADLDEPLLELYQQALENYPVEAAQLQEHLLHQAPLGDMFDPDFG